ncbi:MAG: sugar O-acetyltransferase [Lachnospiraceae bacterium]|nr:sugar O-acetyltransferase [Lachnospiraceae bacterium]
MTQYDRMKAGLIYNPAAPQIEEEQFPLLENLYDFNHTRPSEQKKRQELMQKMFGSIGKGCYIEPPFHANWAGKNVFFGDYVYANFNLTIVDDGNVYVGDKVMFGPNVVIATANHPIHPSLREDMLQYNKDVHIGRCVWIGAGAVIVPGVTIGDNSVIGAGSIVTKDIPANVVAVGNPCKVIREIGQRDKEFFYKEEAIDWEEILAFPPMGSHQSTDASK